jgi:hypothetical protein
MLFPKVKSIITMLLSEFNYSFSISLYRKKRRIEKQRNQIQLIRLNNFQKKKHKSLLNFFKLFIYTLIIFVFYLFK